MKKVLLMILDGWGIADNPEVSAIDKARTPYMDKFWATYPHTTLNTSGLAVGLPEGQMGNSEVGHMNLGAGRVVYQNLVKINLAIEKGEFFKEKVLLETFEYCKSNDRALHLIGLASDGGVHSHINHLFALVKAAEEFGLEKIYIHAFTDGRDCDPKSGLGFIQSILEVCSKGKARLASVIGRYYAMDRDKRWERVKLAYDAMVHAKGELTNDVLKSIQNRYEQDITDEFLEPIIIAQDGNPTATIQPNDAVICFNFRTDRGREITEALTQKDFPELGMSKLPLKYVTLTEYDATFKNVDVIYFEDNLDNTLGEVLAKAGKNQIRIAETEKYPHVTFFFSGGREEPFLNEKRILCPSPKDVPTYDLKPEMAAFDIRNAIIPELKSQWADFICLNFANADMVGHTGSMEAAIKACEAVDTCMGEVAETALENGYTIFILADHGNSDCMINPDGTPNTQHTTNPVPFLVLDSKDTYQLKPGKLGDIAPSILSVMGLPIPTKMSGEVLVSS